MTEDVNGYQQEGFSSFDRTCYRGRRWNAARAYVHPVKNRSNLKVVCQALTTKSPFPREKSHGRGIRRKGKKTVKVYGGEIICCGGSINSPQLLQLSGVGNADELSALGIDVVQDLTGVGENLQDHLEVYVQYACKKAGQPVSCAETLATTVDRLPVAVPAKGNRRQQPFRGRWIHQKQRPSRISQPPIPFPSHRHPLRRFRGAAGPRLPGACRPHEHRCPGTRQDQVRPIRPSIRRSASTTFPRPGSVAIGSKRSAARETS